MAEKRCLIIFAREPRLGKVKTRLAKTLSSERALNFYRAFVLDTLATARRSSCEVMVLAYDSDGPASWLRNIADGCAFHRQKGADLGQRMLNAISSCRKRFPGCLTVLIGTDMPHFPASVINQAFRALQKKDLVLGPCDDGGFYLIGLKRLPGELFKDVVWSSPNVLRDTIRNVKTLGLKEALLEKGYDVDTIADLKRLRTDLRERGSAVATRRLLNL